MTDKEIRALIERRRKDWRYGNSVEAKYKAEECDDILKLMDEQEEPVSKGLEKEVLHGKRCSKCGDVMKADTSVIYTSNPPMYLYECPNCGNREYGLCSENN